MCITVCSIHTLNPKTKIEAPLRMSAITHHGVQLYDYRCHLPRIPLGMECGPLTYFYDVGMDYYDQHIRDYCHGVLLNNGNKPLTEHVIQCWEYIFGEC
jgi:hypothetical protein